MESVTEKNSSIVMYNASQEYVNRQKDFFILALEKFIPFCPAVTCVLTVSKNALDELGIFAAQDLSAHSNSYWMKTGDEIVVTELDGKIHYACRFKGINVTDDRGKAKIDVPIMLYHRRVGHVTLYHSSSELNSELLDAVSPLIANLLKSLEKRCTQYRVENQFGFYWFGNSLAVRETEQNCRLFSNLPIPVLLSGAPGTGKLVAAYAIYCFSNKANTPFIDLDCSAVDENFQMLLSEKFTLAHGGVLYIRNIEALSAKDLGKVLNLVSSSSRVLKTRLVNVRILLGINEYSDQLINRCVLDEIEFYCLKLKMPTIKDRWNDVAVMIREFKKRRIIHEKFQLSDDVWAIISDYQWPGNFGQFEAFLKKTNLLACNHVVNVNLIRKYFPNIIVNAEKYAAAELDGQITNPAVKLVINGEVVCHQAVVRACNYIYEHYAQTITMSELASHSCISASHLSSLFKKELAMSFKQALNEYRIYLAKVFFAKTPAKQITVVAQEVGFSDFSHFEKTFKKNTGVSPGTYRNKFRVALSTN